MEVIRYIESIPSNQCFSWLSHRKESSLKLSEVLNILCKGYLRGWQGISDQRCTMHCMGGNFEEI